MSDDRSSLLSTSTYASSALSEEPASLFDGGASVKSFSDTASIFSTSSKPTPRQSGCLVQTQFDPPETQTGTHSSQENSPSALLSPDSARSADSSSTPTATTPKQKSSFMCSFCKEIGIIKTCTRKNDLKRHIEDFHHTNAQWVCRYRGCQLVFDWQTAYKAHLKAEHGGSRISLDEAKVNLCPQVVFACGFENCLQVFEAGDDAEAPQVFKDYVAHVVKHFDDGAQSGEWTYSRRMKNLLSQSQVHAAWVSSGLDPVSRSRLQWDPQTSRVLRKRLECRHVKDPALLVRCAMSLVTEFAPAPDLPEDFVTPLRDTCTEPGHGMPKRAQPDSAEQSNFRISRGPDPALAQYLNAQRRIYAPREPNSRRHTHHSSQQSMSTTSPASNPTNGLGHYSLLNSRANSAHYDGLSESLPSPVFSHNSQFSMDGIMHQQEFMRSSSPEDIGMADATVSQASMSIPYSGIMHQPRTADIGLEQGDFYQDEGRQNGSVLSGEYLEKNIQGG